MLSNWFLLSLKTSHESLLGVQIIYTVVSLRVMFVRAKKAFILFYFISLRCLLSFRVETVPAINFLSFNVLRVYVNRFHLHSLFSSNLCVLLCFVPPMTSVMKFFPLHSNQEEVRGQKPLKEEVHGGAQREDDGVSVPRRRTTSL